MGVNNEGDAAEGNDGLMIGGSGTDLSDCGTSCVMMICVGIIGTLGSDVEFFSGFGCTLGYLAGF